MGQRKSFLYTSVSILIAFSTSLTVDVATRSHLEASRKRWVW